MALKDWKKVGNNTWRHYPATYNKNNVEKIVLEYLPGKTNSYKWEVYFVGLYQSGVAESFKTKSQALKFAKSYMRKH